MDMQEYSKKILEKAAKNKINETPEQTQNRVKITLEKRQQAVSKIENFQKQYGTPSKKETIDFFLQHETGLGLTLEELQSIASEDKEDK